MIFKSNKIQIYFNKYYAFLILFVMFYEASFGQVEVNPEIGISYFNQTIYGGISVVDAKDISMLIGINTSLPINKKITLNTRIVIINREDYQWTGLCTCPGFQYHKYENNNISMDMNLNYNFLKYLNIGIGPATTKKINSNIITKNDDNETRRKLSNLYFALNGAVQLKLKYFIIAFNYTRNFKNEDLLVFSTSGKNRFDISFSPRIQKLLKKKH